MEVLKNNKGLIMFYISIVIFTIFWVGRVEKTNDAIMYEKNPYILKDNL